MKVKKNYCYLVILLRWVTFFGSGFFSTVYAQNLVPNPSFENNNCSSVFWNYGISASSTDFNCVVNWQAPMNDASPDYFNSASTWSGNNVPLNDAGYQNGHTGNAYAGIYSFAGFTDYREYIYVPLNSALTIGVTYTAEMYVSLADSSPFMGNNLGMLFTTNNNPVVGFSQFGALNGLMSQPIGSQLLNNANVQGNASGWTLISFTFTASAAHTYLFIGNFFNDASTTIQSVTNASWDGGYYYIDDVSVVQVLTTSVTHTNASCSGQCTGTATALPTNGTAPYTYSWSNAQTTSAITGLCSGTYTVNVTDANGYAAIGTASVTIQPGPTGTVTASAEFIPAGASIILTAFGGGTYAWSNGATNAIIIVSPTITTEYCITVTDANNCSDTACVTVTVEPTDCSGELFLPNAFSPNEDGENDVLEIYFGNTSCIKNFKLIIYDRWGEKAFETTDPDFQWDGVYKTKPQGENTTVFDYYMWATFVSGKAINGKGNISLLK